MVQTSRKVPFTLDIVTKCKCPGCPVQEASSCVMDLKKGLNDALKKQPLQKADIPGAYCGTGKATCTDLDPKQGCICDTCAVYSQYELAKGKPDGYFCAQGAAK
jgi:hypothetical protein